MQPPAVPPASHFSSSAAAAPAQLQMPLMHTPQGHMVQTLDYKCKGGQQLSDMQNLSNRMKFTNYNFSQVLCPQIRLFLLN